MTSNDKCPVPNCVNFTSPIQMQLSLKGKTFSGSFVPVLDSTLDFKDFEKKDDRHSYFFFGNYRLSKTWLDHSLKNTVSENPLTVNMLRGPKLF